MAQSIAEPVPPAAGTANQDPAPSGGSLDWARFLVAQFSDLVFRLALSHTACLGDAEDAMQEVFVTYLRKQPVLRDQEHAKAWLIRTTLNVARNVAQSSWRTRVVPMTAQQEQAVAPTQFEFQSDTQNDIFRAVQALPEGQREVVHLFYLEDLPVAQIAQLLDLEPAAVKMRLSRAREVLRDQLKGDYFHE